MAFLTGKLYLSWLALVTVAYLYNAVACTLRPSFVTALVNSKEVNSTWVNKCSTTNKTDNFTQNSFLNFSDDDINTTQPMMNLTNLTATTASDNFTTRLDLNDTSTSTTTNTYSTEVISLTTNSQEMNVLGTHSNATHPQTNSAVTTVQTMAYNMSYNESTPTGIAQTIRSRYETTETSLGFESPRSKCWELVNETHYYYKEGSVALINYRPQTKFREGTVFTHVCLSTRGGVAFPQCHGNAELPHTT